VEISVKVELEMQKEVEQEPVEIEMNVETGVRRTTWRSTAEILMAEV
jgi:hypothetical protein